MDETHRSGSRWTGSALLVAMVLGLLGPGAVRGQEGTSAGRSDETTATEPAGLEEEKPSERVSPWEEGEPLPARFELRMPEGAVEAGPAERTYRYFGRLPDATRFQGSKGAGERFPLAGLMFAPLPSERVHDVGPWRMTGSVAAASRFTDNVYLEPEGGTADVTTTVSPSVGAELAKRRASISARYNANVVLPAQSWDENQRVDHEFVTAAGWRAHETLRFLFVNVFGIRAVTGDFEGDENKGFKDNSTTLTVAYSPLESWSASLSVDHYFAIFDADTLDQDDVYQDTGTLTLYRRLLRKFWLFAYGSAGAVTNRNDPDVDTDNNTWGAGTGLTWSPRRQFNGRVQVGYTLKDFHSERVDDSQTVTYQGVINYAMSRRFSLHLAGQREIFETTASGLSANTGATYTRTSGSLTGKYRLSRQWSVQGQALGGLDDYSEQDPDSGRRREDWLYGAVMGIYWAPRTWCTVNLIYEFQQNESNIDENDFTENSVTLGARISF